MLLLAYLLSNLLAVNRTYFLAAFLASAYDYSGIFAIISRSACLRSRLVSRKDSFKDKKVCNSVLVSISKLAAI